jgi:hypothetical protein
MILIPTIARLGCKEGAGDCRDRTRCAEMDTDRNLRFGVLSLQANLNLSWQL